MIYGMATRAGHLALNSPFHPGCDSGPARLIEEPEYQVPSPCPTSTTPATDTANVVTATNVAYVATSVSTSPNPAYQPVAPPQGSDFTASVNPTYQLMIPSRESVDIATATNVAYVTTDITASVNPAYRPLQGTSDGTSDSMYDYATI